MCKRLLFTALSATLSSFPTFSNIVFASPLSPGRASNNSSLTGTRVATKEGSDPGRVWYFMNTSPSCRTSVSFIRGCRHGAALNLTDVLAIMCEGTRHLQGSWNRFFSLLLTWIYGKVFHLELRKRSLLNAAFLFSLLHAQLCYQSECSSWGFKCGWRLCQPACIRITLMRWMSQWGSSGALLSGKKSRWLHPLLLHLTKIIPALAPKLSVVGIRKEEQKRQWPHRWSSPSS